MIVMDRKDYTYKTKSLLADTTNYKTITKDPTYKVRHKLSQKLRDIKNQGGLSSYNCRKMYLTGAAASKCYGLPKIHNVDTPLSPLFQVGFITYGVAKEQANIIYPLVGQSPHHLKNTKISYNKSRK